MLPMRAAVTRRADGRNQNMATDLTLLIPNYNRPRALARLLESVFGSIRHADAEARVRVVVVDDYSESDLSEAIAPYAGRHNFRFALQPNKCGNAETAFLSSLAFVETEYVWLLGNDDFISEDGIDCVLRILDSTAASFVLLNPIIYKHAMHRGFAPITATSDTILYQRSEDLFLDFGFVTSTTTFPCLVMKTDPVRSFHRRYCLTKHGTVYAHTFSLFGALRDEPGLFLTSPVVGFSGSERIEEQRKLQRQAPQGITFYHHSLGLARLIRACAAATGVDVRTLGEACEDEVDKDNMQVLPTYLSHFLMFYFLEQMCQEQNNIARPRGRFSHLTKPEMEEISSVILQFEDKALQHILTDANEIFAWQGASPQWKEEFLRIAQQRVKTSARRHYDDLATLRVSTGPRKVAMPNHILTPLRGTAGGPHGLPLMNA